MPHPSSATITQRFVHGVRSVSPWGFDGADERTVMLDVSDLLFVVLTNG